MSALAVELEDDDLEDWRARAACPGRSTRWRDPWHQEARYPEARQICSGCPVQQQCLAYALDVLDTTGQVEGIYGGLRPDGLRALARSIGRTGRKVAQHGTRARYVSWKCRCGPCRTANARYKASRSRVAEPCQPDDPPQRPRRWGPRSYA